MTPWQYPRYAAHRGAGKLAPENTLAAMRAGYTRDYRMVEFDVRLSGDGVPFLLHDDTLDRTSNGRGRADALTWAELAKLDAGSWHSPEYAGETMPTLAAVARWAIANGVACNIEIKPTPGRERETGAAVAIDALTLWDDAAPPPLLSSFSEAALFAARGAVRELPRVVLYDGIPSDWEERVSSLECVAINVDYRALDEARVADVHLEERRIMTFTPNDLAVVESLLAWGVDCIITDAIDVIRPA